MNYKEYIAKVGLQNISKEQLLCKIEELYTQLDSQRDNYFKIIEDRDAKIIELLEEREKYKEYYYATKATYDKLAEEVKDFVEKQMKPQDKVTTEVILSTCKNSFYNILCLQIHKPTAVWNIQLGNIEYYSDASDFEIEELSTAYLVSRDSFPLFKVDKKTHKVTDYRE